MQNGVQSGATRVATCGATCGMTSGAQDVARAGAQKQGLLVDYYWCTGCHSCEVACQMELGLPPEQYGIKLATVGPWQYSEENWQFSHFPLLTEQCDLCAERQTKGKKPSCVQHCQANCLKLVTAQEAASSLAENRRQMFITL